jgi:hypothetical protein
VTRLGSTPDGKLRCQLCHQRVDRQFMTSATRPCGKVQWYCPPCDERRWRYAETPKGMAIAASRARRLEESAA